MSANLKEFAGKIDQVSRKVADPGGGIMREVGREAKRLIEGSVRPATGGNMRLSGVGRKGASISIRDRRMGSSVEITARGPIHLIERDTSPHVIGRGRGGRGRRAKIIRFPSGDVVTGGFRHPGTRGKHAFERGANKVRVVAPVIYGRALSREIGKVF